MLEIPVERLADDVLQALLEEYIAREGTDYGAVECSMADKVRQLRAQLSRSELVICFDSQTESCTLCTRRAFLKAQESARGSFDE